ncbi:MAG: MMPL family transporter [Aeromicrobium sp.]
MERDGADGSVGVQEHERHGPDDTGGSGQLAAVFTVLGLLPPVARAQIGVLICIGVLLDTLLIRTVLVPAIALVLGDRFWWPHRRSNA